MRCVDIPMREEIRQKLLDLARREHRRPADQAALILERALVLKTNPRTATREHETEDLES